MIRLQFSDEANPAQWIIDRFTRCKFSHVDAILPDGSLFGARPIGGVAARPQRYHDFTRVLSVDLPCDEIISDKFLAFLGKQAGKPYDWRACITFLKSRQWQEDDSWFCSELIAAALIECGWFDRPLYFASSRVSPADLLLLISSRVPIPGG
jgi:uncharacterized protein YycO